MLIFEAASRLISALIRTAIASTHMAVVPENRYTPIIKNEIKSVLVGDELIYEINAEAINKAPPPESSASSLRKSITRFCVASSNSVCLSVFMKRISFKRVVMQRLGRIAILGETLLPISVGAWSVA